MTAEKPAPLVYDGVMISSTFSDLAGHRAGLMRALAAHGLYSVAMEHDSALPETVIDSSLRKVREGAAYILIIGHRYGNVPECGRNPERLSLTELEYREAVRLGRPILLFLIGPDHDLRIADIDRDPERTAKLQRFREDVQRVAAGSGEHRVHAVFNSAHEFEVAAMQSVAELSRHLDRQRPGQAGEEEAESTADTIPGPPTLYAEPPYTGSHTFVGRAEELQRLSHWATGSEPLLLVEAIGGAGKSMLTWQWTNVHAREARPDLAGVFWYSFYDKGAIMADFCRHALAYMTGAPMETLKPLPRRELRKRLTRQLNARPWLLVLDGLERVLVAYHRYDAAQLADERAGQRDKLAQRDPCVAIRPEDDELLRMLAGAGPSKILITSRLVPRVLLNSTGRPIPGVVHHRLGGLRPPDAEALLRGCGIRGDSARIQDYLQRHCECHPLVVGVLGGLVNDYLPRRGNFDAWSADLDEGGKVAVGELDIVQKRNHILSAAFDALHGGSRELLSTLALLSEAADYETLSQLNPHADAVDAERRLTATVKDLESRGLLQYDRNADRYDLHPVVRAVAASRLGVADTSRLGQLVVDYFSRDVRPFERAETLDDLRNGLTVVRTYVRMGRLAEASKAFNGPLSDALQWRLKPTPKSWPCCTRSSPSTGPAQRKVRIGSPSSTCPATPAWRSPESANTAKRSPLPWPHSSTNSMPATCRPP